MVDTPEVEDQKEGQEEDQGEEESLPSKSFTTPDQLHTRNANDPNDPDAKQHLSSDTFIGLL